MEKEINYEEKCVDLENRNTHLKQLYDDTHKELCNERLQRQRLEALNERLLKIIENLSEND